MDITSNSTPDSIGAEIMEALAGPVGFWDDAEIISMYTRAQAISDGVLVDYTTEAKALGFRVPVAFTECLVAHLEVRAMMTGGTVQNEVSSALLQLLGLIRGGGENTDRIFFALPARRGTDELEVWSHIGPGDDAEPVMTIMLLGED